jgi:hypothetical protein
MFKPGANITISAIASDSDGKVTKVEFYDGDTKLGEDTSAPYVYKWKNVPAGSHTLTARATDDKDAVGISDARNVHLLVMRDPEDPADTVQGVAYKYYVGSWAKCPISTH